MLSGNTDFTRVFTFCWSIAIIWGNILNQLKEISMLNVHKKLVYITVTILFVAPMIAMEVVLKDQTKSQRIAQLRNLLLQKMPPQGKMMERDCDSKPDSHTSYLEFSPNGKHLIQARRHSKANLVITDNGYATK